jgi:hypothetical protein
MNQFSSLPTQRFQLQLPRWLIGFLIGIVVHAMLVFLIQNTLLVLLHIPLLIIGDALTRVAPEWLHVGLVLLIAGFPLGVVTSLWYCGKRRLAVYVLIGGFIVHLLLTLNELSKPGSWSIM